MSRYTIECTHTTYGAVTVTYGFDHLLTEFFIIIEQDENADPVFAVASYNTTFPHPDQPGKIKYSNHELLPLFKEFGVCDEHCDKLALDLAF